MPPLVNGFADTLMFGSVNRKYTTFIRNFNIPVPARGRIYRLLIKAASAPRPYRTGERSVRAIAGALQLVAALFPAGGESLRAVQLVLAEAQPCFAEGVPFAP